MLVMCYNNIETPEYNNIDYHCVCTEAHINNNVVRTCKNIFTNLRII